jgi:2,3-bisphosphoglycerate-independent phosphoglycerate mutase
MLIIADHGNADYITNDDGTPNTAHSKNPVPCILVDDNLQKGQALRDGILADVAPTILELMGIDKPPEMTGNSML